MRQRRGAVAAVFALTMSVAATTAEAGAWPAPKGEGLLILKAEDEQADHGFSPRRDRAAIPHLRDDYLSLYGEYGLTPRLTLQGKASFTDGRDQYISYSGRGPIELGLRWAVLQSDRTVLSLYVGGVAPGVGRNAAYAGAGQGGGDAELRVLFGRSARVAGRETFIDLEAARVIRSGGLADETRLDLTAGARLTPKWMVLLQSFAGRADGAGYRSDWVKLEGGVVRDLGPWSLQAGWRSVVAGRETPISSGPVLGVWRRF